jgi:UDP-N-acetylmuramate--alanine ligase
VLTDIYAAGESPIEGITIEAVADAVRAAVGSCPVHVVKNIDDVPAAVSALARDGDLVITLGAGSIGTVVDRILDALRGSQAAGHAESSAEAGGTRADSSAEAGGEGG